MHLRLSARQGREALVVGQDEDKNKHGAEPRQPQQIPADKNSKTVNQTGCHCRGYYIYFSFKLNLHPKNSFFTQSLNKQEAECAV